MRGPVPHVMDAHFPVPDVARFLVVDFRVVRWVSGPDRAVHFLHGDGHSGLDLRMGEEGGVGTEGHGPPVG